MPSINRSIKIHGLRRLRINTCEGEVGISDEALMKGNRWEPQSQINMTREQAQELIEALTEQMANHY